MKKISWTIFFFVNLVVLTLAAEGLISVNSKNIFEQTDHTLVNNEEALSWDSLMNGMRDSFTKQELFDGKNEFYVEKGFMDDFQYIKNKTGYLTMNSIQMLKQWAQYQQDNIDQVDLKEGTLSLENLTQEMKSRLVLAAQKARTSAYAPYSKFHVGAAVLTKSGKIYSGCNFENAAYGNTICAERSAIGNALTKENRGISFQKDQNIIAVAVVIRGGNGSPCGNCRQALYEFNPNMLVIMSDIDNENYKEVLLKDLLPMGFGPLCLDEAKVE